MSILDQFTLIDWRDEFGLSKNIGDVNYDLAKLYGGIHINYREMRKASNAIVIYNGDDVTLNCMSSSSGLIEFRTDKYFESWVSANGFSLNTIKTLTGLIYLSMTPIHEQPFADYLFYKAKELLSDR